MKQNIFGAILFTTIVGTAVFVSASLVKLPSPPPIQEMPIQPKNVYESRNSCSKRSYKNVSKITVNQAVLNPRTDKLHTNLTIERKFSGNSHIGVTYHFFVKEGAETRFVASETVAIQPNFDAGNKAFHEVLSSYNWLDKIDSKSNLYLIASTDNDGFAKANSIPRFDESNAVPVLLMKGKN
jgi:hypothetical protein